MDNSSYGDGSIKGLVITFICGIVAHLTLNHVAIVATILAGLSTFGLNIYRYYKLKNKKHD